MSILDSLRRFIDPIAHRQIVAERRRKAQTPRSDEDKGEDKAPARECRVCGYAGDHDYCPRCLANTMVKPRRR